MAVDVGVTRHSTDEYEVVLEGAFVHVSEELVRLKSVNPLVMAQMYGVVLGLASGGRQFHSLAFSQESIYARRVRISFAGNPGAHWTLTLLDDEPRTLQ